MVRDLVTFLILWFSFPIKGFGATPVGVVPMSFMLRLTSKGWICVIVMLLVLCLPARSMGDFVMAGSLLVGPLILVGACSGAIHFSKRVLVMVCVIASADTLAGGIVSGLSMRGYSFLTQEPSHVARIYFPALYLLLAIFPIIRKRHRLKIIGWAAIFLVLNKSSSAFLFFIILLVVLLNDRIAFRSLGALLAVSFLAFLSLVQELPNRPETPKFLTHVSKILVKREYQSLEKMLNQLGSRRLLQSVAAINSSTLSGHGYSFTFEEFMATTEKAGISLSEVPRVIEKRGTTSSYLSELLYTCGFLISAVILLALLVILQTQKLSVSSKTLFLAGILQLAFFSTTTISAPWLTIAASFLWKK